jgi:hypothetical protein
VFSGCGCAFGSGCTQPVCRCHPAPGPRHSVSLSGSLALTKIQVEYAGHTYVYPVCSGLAAPDRLILSAHAALSPWEGAFHDAEYLHLAASYITQVKTHLTPLSWHIRMCLFYVSNSSPLTASTGYSVDRIGRPTVPISYLILTALLIPISVIPDNATMR